MLGHLLVSRVQLGIVEIRSYDTSLEIIEDYSLGYAAEVIKRSDMGGYEALSEGPLSGVGSGGKRTR